MTPSPSPTLVATPTSSQLASAPAGSDAALPLQVTHESLPAGRYTRPGFQPRITFELDGTWRAVQLFPGFFDVQDHPGSPDVIAVQFANVDRVYGANAEPLVPNDAAAAAAVLARHPNLRVLESSESKIGGLTGSQITVENATGGASGGAASGSPGGATSGTPGGAVRILDVPPGPLSILPDRRLWLAFFDTPNGVLAIMVGGSVAKWQETLDAAEPILESVTIGP